VSRTVRYQTFTNSTKPKIQPFRKLRVRACEFSPTKYAEDHFSKLTQAYNQYLAHLYGPNQANWPHNVLIQNTSFNDFFVAKKGEIGWKFFEDFYRKLEVQQDPLVEGVDLLPFEDIYPPARDPTGATPAKSPSRVLIGSPSKKKPGQSDYKKWFDIKQQEKRRLEMENEGEEEEEPEIDPFDDKSPTKRLSDCSIMSPEDNKGLYIDVSPNKFGDSPLGGVPSLGFVADECLSPTKRFTEFKKKPKLARAGTLMLKPNVVPPAKLKSRSGSIKEIMTNKKLKRLYDFPFKCEPKNLVCNKFRKFSSIVTFLYPIGEKYNLTVREDWYSSYWLKLIDRCLQNSDLEQIKSIGYYEVIEEKKKGADIGISSPKYPKQQPADLVIRDAIGNELPLISLPSLDLDNNGDGFSVRQNKKLYLLYKIFCNVHEDLYYESLELDRPYDQLASAVLSSDYLCVEDDPALQIPFREVMKSVAKRPEPIDCKEMMGTVNDLIIEIEDSCSYCPNFI
jgi:hypothetical protein